MLGYGDPVSRSGSPVSGVTTTTVVEGGPRPTGGPLDPPGPLPCQLYSRIGVFYLLNPNSRLLVKGGVGGCVGVQSSVLATQTRRPDPTSDVEGIDDRDPGSLSISKVSGPISPGPSSLIHLVRRSVLVRSVFERKRSFGGPRPRLRGPVGERSRVSNPVPVVKYEQRMDSRLSSSLRSSPSGPSESLDEKFPDRDILEYYPLGVVRGSPW